MEIKSPLDPDSTVKLVREIDTKLIVEGYMRNYGIDVSFYFKDIQHLAVYSCSTTGFRFYHPFGLSGDGDFYRKLQGGKDYYIPWKWEHEIALGYLKQSHKNILEVGSGGNGFLMRMKSMGRTASGLELNQDSIKRGRAHGLNVLPVTVEDHATHHEECYDVVCSFQVLEHVSDPLSFLNSKVKCLRKGGMLIVSVPNNESDFLKYNCGAVINMPPHHLGLWDEKSLLSLGRLLPLQLISTHFEPLQEYHVEGYTGVWLQRKVGNRYIRFILNRCGGRGMLIRWFSRQRMAIRGHSVLAVFKKL